MIADESEQSELDLSDDKHSFSLPTFRARAEVITVSSWKDAAAVSVMSALLLQVENLARRLVYNSVCSVSWQRQQSLA